MCNNCLNCWYEFLNKLCKWYVCLLLIGLVVDLCYGFWLVCGLGVVGFG